MAVLALCLVYLLASSATQALAYRRLRAEEATVPICSWLYDECTVNPDTALTLAATDDRAKYVQKVAALQHSCSTFNSQQTCQDGENSISWCGWDIELDKCVPNPTPNYMTILLCPDSKMAAMMECTSQHQNTTECPSPNCKMVNYTMPASERRLRRSLRQLQQVSSTDEPETMSTTANDQHAVCMPVSMSENDTMVAAAIQEFTEVIENAGDLFDAEWWGKCAGATLLREMASGCAYNTSVACQAKSHCTWAPALGEGDNGSCDMRVFGGFELLAEGSAGDFGTSMAKYYTNCRQANTSETCAAVGTRKFDESAVATALAYASDTAVDNVTSNGTNKTTGTVKSAATTTVAGFVQVLVGLMAAVLVLTAY